MRVRLHPSTAPFSSIQIIVSTESPVSARRPIRSFVIRSGRLTDSQRKAIADHWQEFVIPTADALLNLQGLFPHPGRLVIEIGFGMGDSLLAMARQEPATNFIGIEVHQPGIGKLLHGIAEQRLQNLKIICRDATEVFSACVPVNTVDKVQIYFPDPWPKKKHQKRRIVQPDFMALLRDRLQPGGQIHLATDWEEYARYMLEVMEAVPGMRNHEGAGNFWAQPLRPDTKFEARGKRLGHGVWDLLYVKE